VNKETLSVDAQHILGAIDQLLSLNGWVAALCPTLTRPFGQNKRDGAYDDLIRDATHNNLSGIEVRVASLADIIRSKQAANRPKDQRVLPTLREILASRNPRNPS